MVPAQHLILQCMYFLIATGDPTKEDPAHYDEEQKAFCLVLFAKQGPDSFIDAFPRTGICFEKEGIALRKAT